MFQEKQDSDHTSSAGTGKNSGISTSSALNNDNSQTRRRNKYHDNDIETSLSIVTGTFNNGSNEGTSSVVLMSNDDTSSEGDEAEEEKSFLSWDDNKRATNYGHKSPPQPKVSDSDKIKLLEDQISIMQEKINALEIASASASPQLAAQSPPQLSQSATTTTSMRNLALLMGTGAFGSGDYSLNEDIFSIIFVAPVFSVSFLYAIFVFGLQLSILILSMVNILKDADPDANKLMIPPYTELEINFAQFIAILISVMVSNDVVQSLDVLLIEYDTGIVITFHDASYFKWALSNICRFIEGFLGIVVAFIFIVQATNVLDLFLNFLAVQFVSELDNVAFYLADKGYLPFREIMDLTNSISDARMKKEEDKEQVVFVSNKKLVKDARGKKAKSAFRRRMQLGVFYSMLILLYSCWSAVKIAQAKGVFYKMECEFFHVTLPNLEYQFFHKCRENGSCPKSWKSRKNPLKYPDFNGLYVELLNKDGTLVKKDHRPVYKQQLAGDSDFGDDSPPGQFSYCIKEEAWVFSIPGVTKGSNADDCSWLLKSPETEVLTLNYVPEGDWQVWTGAIDEGFVDITCAECMGGEKTDDQTGDIGCNFHGQCRENGTCDCVDGFLGTQCSTCADCSIVEIDNEISESLGYELKLKWPGNFKRLDYPDGRAYEFYDRPVYYHSTKDMNLDVLSKEITEDPLVVFLYWADQYVLWDFSDRVLEGRYNERKAELKTILDAFHPLWGYDESKAKPSFVSEQTKARLGMRGLKWRAYDDYLQNPDFSIGEYETLDFHCESYEHGNICTFSIFN